MSISSFISKRLVFILSMIVCLSCGLVVEAKAANAAVVGSTNQGNFLTVGGGVELRSLLTRVGLGVDQLNLSDAAGPFSDQASDVFASYSQEKALSLPLGVAGLVVSPGDVLTLGWHERGQPFFRSYRYDVASGGWTNFVQSNVQLSSFVSMGAVAPALNTSEVLNITFSPPSVVSTTTGVKSFTVTNGNGSTYFAISLTKKIAAIYIQGSLNGVFQVAGVGTTVLVASATPAGAKGTVPVLVVYADQACP